MRREQEMVREFMLAAKQELPSALIIPPLPIRILRAKLMLEEVLETITKGLGVNLVLSTLSDREDFNLNDVLQYSKKTGWWCEVHSGSLTEIADGCADTKVVTIGTELTCGIDGEPVFDEVHRSNMTKFIDGHRREDGKWVKGPSYTPANLHAILET